MLYVGAGCGREIAGACQRGAQVTCVEPCPAMAKRLAQQLTEHASRVQIKALPIQSVRPDTFYDMVVSHFFLNLFTSMTVPLLE